MKGQIIEGKTSLLRAFLLSMIIVACLFGALALGIWIYTTDVIKSEKLLISELLPELDVAYQLTAATAALQSQGLLLSSSEDEAALAERRRVLGVTISQSRRLSTLATIELAERTELKLAVDDISRVASGLTDMKMRQLSRKQTILADQQHLVGALTEVEKSIQQQIVGLTDELYNISELNNTVDEQVGSSSTAVQLYAASVSQRISQYESVSLAIQDYLLLIQDVVALSAIIERVPLLTTTESVELAIQSRDLLIRAMVSRSIYIKDEFTATFLLPSLRRLRVQLHGEDSLFALQKVVITLLGDQQALDSLLTEHTSRILMLTENLRNNSRNTVNLLAANTLTGLDRYRGFLLLVSALIVLALAGISYWLLYRKTVVPLVAITQQLDDVGSERFPTETRAYFLRELTTLSSAMGQLDAVQKSMKVKDAELQFANQDLERANQELEQFAHIASHDLQEPLRKLQQFSTLLEEDYESVLDDDGRFFLSTIRNSAQRMSVMIKDTLAYSRSGSTNQKIEPVDLAELIKQLREEMDLAIQDADAEFDVAQLPVVYANSVGMAQLFRNLIVNALKYKKPDTPARVSISMAGSWGDPFQPVVIRVKDNGIGIDNQYLERIFQPFERLQSGDVRGTGLGLAICKKVVESHGWELQVRSELGKGTSFDIQMSVANLVE